MGIFAVSCCNLWQSATLPSTCKQGWKLHVTPILFHKHL